MGNRIALDKRVYAVKKLFVGLGVSQKDYIAGLLRIERLPHSQTVDFLYLALQRPTCYRLYVVEWIAREKSYYLHMVMHPVTFFAIHIDDFFQADIGLRP